MHRVIETHLIETFVEVVRRGSVTEAAEALHRSQPAISHRLRQLEEAFGTPLFEKVGRELQLTRAGERLVDDAVDIVARIRALPSRVTEPESIRGTVSVGALPAVGSHMLIDAARHVLSELADVKLVLQQGDVPEMRSRLVAGDLDIIVVVGRLDPSGLDVRVAGEVRARVGMTEQLAPHGPLTVEHLRERRYLAWQGETDPMLDAIEEWALAHEFVGATTPVVPNVETLRALARAGAGYVVLPDYVMRRDESLITFEAPGLSRSLPVRVAVRKGLPESPATHVLEALVGHLES